MHQNVHQDKCTVNIANHYTSKLHFRFQAINIAVNLVAGIHIIVVQRTYQKSELKSPRTVYNGVARERGIGDDHFIIITSILNNP